MREISRKVLTGILIVAFSYLLVANVLHFTKIRETRTLMFKEETGPIKIQKANYQTLQSNLVKLNTITKTFHLDEGNYKEVKELLTEGVNKIEEAGIVNDEYNKEYDDVEVMKLLQKSSILSIINAYDIVIKNDSNSGFVKDEVIAEYIELMMNQSTIQNQVLSNFTYHTSYQDILTVANAQVQAATYNNGVKVKLLTDLSNYLVKDGGIHE